jgi:hypothetical protein
VGEEEARADLLAQAAQVVVVPRRKRLAEQARHVALAIPTHAEPVAVGLDLGLVRLQALRHQ